MIERLLLNAIVIIIICCSTPSLIKHIKIKQGNTWVKALHIYKTMKTYLRLLKDKKKEQKNIGNYIDE